MPGPLTSLGVNDMVPVSACVPVKDSHEVPTDLPNFSELSHREQLFDGANLGVHAHQVHLAVDSLVKNLLIVVLSVCNLGVAEKLLELVAHRRCGLELLAEVRVRGSRVGQLVS